MGKNGFMSTSTRFPPMAGLEVIQEGIKGGIFESGSKFDPFARNLLPQFRKFNNG